MTKHLLQYGDKWLEPHPRNPTHVIVKRYTRPERFGSLIIPDTAQVDPYWMYWEVIRVGSEVWKIVDIEIPEGSIIQTPFRQPMYLGLSQDNVDIFMVPATVRMMKDGKMQDVGNITAVILKDWEE